jgi:hypothetical protein
MSRRRSGLQPAHLIGATAFLALAGGGVWYFTKDRSSKMAGAPFMADQYQTSYIGMRGNSYVATGVIDKQMRFGPDGSRLFSVKMTPGSVPVAVLVPPGITENIQVGQEFQMMVIVEKDGLLRVQNLRKS